MRMTPEAGLRLLRDARVARLATVDGSGTPHLVPVTFAVIDLPGPRSPPTIAFAIDHKPKSSTALRRLANIAANPRVCVLVDHYDDDWDQLWWVRADAVAGILDGVQRAGAIESLQAKYPQYQQVPPTGVVVGCIVASVRGWRAAQP